MLQVVDVAVGCGTCYALTDGGDVYAWGAGSKGQLGRGKVAGMLLLYTRVCINSLFAWQEKPDRAFFAFSPPSGCVARLQHLLRCGTGGRSAVLHSPLSGTWNAAPYGS